MPELGHIAYYVRNLERSVAFYQKVVGLEVVARIFQGRAAVLSGGGRHHELLLIQVTTGDGPLTGRRVGLYHAAWKMGNSLNDLRAALDRAQVHGTPVDGTADHKVIFSLYLRDPDDNEVELFVDNLAHDWRRDSSWMEAPVKPLDLSRPQPYETLDAVAPQAQTTPAVGAQPTSSQVIAAVLTDSDDDDGPYVEEDDPDDIAYWANIMLQNQAVVQQADNEPYDSLSDPDDIEYWGKLSQEQAMIAAQEQLQAEQEEALDDDPDSMEYWVRQQQLNATELAAAAQQESKYNELDDPDSLAYWQQAAQAIPVEVATAEPMQQTPGVYNELQEPDVIARSKSATQGKKPQSNQSEYA